MQLWRDDWYDIKRYVNKYLEDAEQIQKALKKLQKVLGKILKSEVQSNYEASNLVRELESAYRDFTATVDSSFSDIELVFSLGEAIRYE